MSRILELQFIAFFFEFLSILVIKVFSAFNVEQWKIVIRISIVVLVKLEVHVASYNNWIFITFYTKTIHFASESTFLNRAALPCSRICSNPYKTIFLGILLVVSSIK